MKNRIALTLGCLVFALALGVTALLIGNGGGSVPEASAGSSVHGDTDCDGEVTSLDALLVLKYVAHLPYYLPPGCASVQEVDCNDALNSLDGLAILRHVAHLATLSPNLCPTPGGGTATPTPAGSTPTPSPCGCTAPPPTPTPTPTPTGGPTETGTRTPTATPFVTPTPTPSPTPTASPSPSPSPTPGPQVLVGSGDIASCNSQGDEATATLLDGIAGTVYTAGDNAYESGTAAEFTNCYEPSWGRHKARTMPAPGNHDYNTANGTGYYGYFGAAAHQDSNGYYSTNLGAWHVIVLNSNCGSIGGCSAASPQGQWLAADLAASGAACTVAIWHHPVITAGPHNHDETGILPLWQMLYDAGTDLIVTGHDHNYQRYGRLNRDVTGTAADGMRQIIAGAGGKDITNIDPARAATTAGLEVWADASGDGDGNDVSFGVLKLTLKPGTYDWEYVPTVAGFTDSGTDACH